MSPPRRPSLFLIGVIAFKIGKTTPARDLGRVAIGLGLMLLSLHILIDALAPAESTPTVRALRSAVTAEPVLCVLIAAVLTWAAHPSAVVVLLVMPLNHAGLRSTNSFESIPAVIKSGRSGKGAR